MLTALLIVGGLVAGVFLVAGLLAGCCRLVTKNGSLSLAVGTLTIPALTTASLFYWLMTMEVDDAPPGMVIIGNFTAIAVVVPIALLASHLTVKFLDRRAVRNGS